MVRIKHQILIFQWMLGIFENVFAVQSGSELHFHCENCQRVPRWEDGAERGEGKFLGAAGPGRETQAGATWCGRDKILWKWGSLPRCFLPLFMSLSSLSPLMGCTFTFQFRPSHLKTSQSAWWDQETSYWPGKQLMEAKGWATCWSMKSLTSGSGSPGR